MLYLYRLILNLIILLLPFILIFRLFKKKENIIRFKEKIGFFSKIKKKEGKLIWFHGASVGEIQSIIPLIERYKNSKKISHILVTSNTVSSSKILENLDEKKVIHQFFPIDNNQIVNKFINHWKPSIALFIDSEIWPNMLVSLEKKNIPIISLNSRITKKSFKKWIRFKKFSKFIFGKFHLCLSSNKESVHYLKKLGAKNIKYYGNLKYAQSENERIFIESHIRKFFNKKKVWCASSTHDSEEEFVGKVHTLLKRKYKNILSVIIPRHIDRANQIIMQMKKLNLKVHLHEPKTKIKEKTDIYLVNSFGKTKSFYSIINDVLLGGSLIEHGGQNPLEAVRYNCNILHGPNTSNFREIYEFLGKKKVSKKIKNINQITKILEKSFSAKKNKINIKGKIKKIGEEILKNSKKEIDYILDNS